MLHGLGCRCVLSIAFIYFPYQRNRDTPIYSTFLVNLGGGLNLQKLKCPGTVSRFKMRGVEEVSPREYIQMDLGQV